SYLQKFNAAGQPIGTQIQIPALASVVQMPSGNLFAAWQRDTTVSSALSWAVYDPTGQPIANIEQPFVGFVTDKEPTVTALTNGTGVIGWKPFESSVAPCHMQRIDAPGQPIGSASVLPIGGALDAQV